LYQLFTDFQKAYDSVRREVLYNNFNEFGIPMKLVRLIQMCLNKTYARDRVGKHVSDTFTAKYGLKQGDILSSLFSNFALKYATRRVHVNQDGLKVDGTHQLVVHADDTYILGGSVQTRKGNTETLVVASKETGLEINYDKTKYMVMSQG
jgi:hypothetical protein